MFSFPVGGGWPQMASRGVSHAALGRAAVRAVLFIRLAAQVCSRKGSWPQDYIKNWVGEGSQEWAGFSSFLETICLSLFLHFLGNNFVYYAVYLSLLNSDLHLTLTCCSFLTPSCTWGCAGRILLPSSPFLLSVSSFQLSKRIGSDNVFVPSSGSEFCVTKSSSGLGQVVILNLSMCLEDGIRWWKPDYPHS